jgi:hypothetical protein
VENYIDTSIMSRLEAEGFIEKAHKEFQPKRVALHWAHKAMR